MKTTTRVLSLEEFLSVKGNPPITIVLSEGTYKIPKISKPRPQNLSQKSRRLGKNNGSK